MQIELNNLVRIYDSADGLSKVAAVRRVRIKRTIILLFEKFSFITKWD